MEDISVRIAKAQSGDKKAREVLIEENLGLVHHIVKRFQGRGYDMEDLFQIGTIGLMKAIDKFDLSFDVKFSTYAVPMISGEIKRFLRDDGMVKVSRSLKENGWKVRQAEAALSAELGREPTLAEVCEKSGLGYEDVVMALEANTEVESIYKTVYRSDGKEIELVDQMAAGRGSQDEEKEKLLTHMMLQQMLEELPRQERLLIKLRYFQDKTQSEVAKVLGTSQVQVSRMEKKILIRMRQRMG